MCRFSQQPTFYIIYYTVGGRKSETLKHWGALAPQTPYECCFSHFHDCSGGFRLENDRKYVPRGSGGREPPSFSKNNHSYGVWGARAPQFIAISYISICFPIYVPLYFRGNPENPGYPEKSLESLGGIFTVNCVTQFTKHPTCIGA